MKIVATIEARMGATRLPKKMALELYPSLSALGAVIERLARCKRVDEVVVATTQNVDDDCLIEVAQRSDVSFFRGSEENVLQRVVDAGHSAHADVLVMMCGDSPCLSPMLIDRGLDFFLSHDYDVVCNCVTETYPIGMEYFIVSFDTLRRVHQMILQPPHCNNHNNFEHTTFFLLKHSDIFNIHNHTAPPRYRRPDLSFVLDTPEDLQVIRSVYSYLYPKNKNFDMDDILHLIQERPEIMDPLRGAEVDRVGY